MNNFGPYCELCGISEVLYVDSLPNFRGDTASVLYVCTNCGKVLRESA